MSQVADQSDSNAAQRDQRMMRRKVPLLNHGKPIVRMSSKELKPKPDCRQAMSNGTSRVQKACSARDQRSDQQVSDIILSGEDNRF